MLYFNYLIPDYVETLASVFWVVTVMLIMLAVSLVLLIGGAELLEEGMDTTHDERLYEEII